PAEEPAEEAPAEEPAEEAPAEEPAEEAPAEEPAEEAPAEEPAEEAPAEETPAEEPAEDAPAEEPAGEAPAEESGEGAGTTRVLFLCTGNSCRSQMAEGILRHLATEGFESLSAGSQPAEKVHPMAIAAMEEIGIDISAQQPKSMDVFLSGDLPAPDVVISVCEKAAAECPALTGGAVNSMSLPFDDPAAADGSDDEKLEVFRRVRDEISETLKMALGVGG
ncbi:MAG: arsenate reductase ArsC, partial [Planctomycetota bacterium]